MTESADNLLRARNALAASGIAIADFFPIDTETGKALAAGELPPGITHGLDVFGDSPLMVWSGSSNALICPNRTRKETLDAIRTLLRNSADATSLIVMRLPGARHGSAFYPHLSGKALSFNPYAWNEYIDPRAGVARLVFGLGSCLDDRSGDDFSRVVPLGAPFRRPETDFDEICLYSQRKMDYLALENGRVESDYFVDVMKTATDIPLQLFVSEGGSPHPVTGTRPAALTFDSILKDTDFVSCLHASLGVLEKDFGRPVEIEFSADFTPGHKFSITLTACRTLPDLPAVQIDPKHRFLEIRGAVVGSSRSLVLDHIVYVSPEEYSALPLSDRYEVARLIGKITRAMDGRILLLGPGRWGTSSPELGIPASFSEISRASAIGEIVAMRKNLVPEVSMGAHILNELVATGMLYFAVFPGRDGHFVNDEALAKAPNQLSKLAPEAKSWDSMIKVIDPEAALLRADVLKQEVTGWITPLNDGKIR
jgi:pyruvate, water dikinase